jgi:NADH-quinone oxidoreductase subunit E
MSKSSKTRLPRQGDPPFTDQARVERVLARYSGRKGAVIPVLQEVQETLGYLPIWAIQAIALGLEVPASQVYGVVTFYAQFRLKPIGKHLCKVCHGTACHVSGATEVSGAILEQLRVVEGATTEDGKFTVESVACLGCCSLAPVIMIDQETFGRLSPDKARKIVKEF